MGTTVTIASTVVINFVYTLLDTLISLAVGVYNVFIFVGMGLVEVDVTVKNIVVSIIF